MAEITVKVDDYTGAIIDKGDLVEVTAVLDGQELRWDFSKATYKLFREQIETFIECAQFTHDDSSNEVPTVQPKIQSVFLFDPEVSAEVNTDVVSGIDEISSEVDTEQSTVHSDVTTQLLDSSAFTTLTQDTNNQKKTKYVSNPPRPRTTLLSQENLKKLSESKGRRVLLLRGASLSNFKKQQVRAAALGVALMQRNIRSHSIQGNKSNYRICDIYGWKI